MISFVDKNGKFVQCDKTNTIMDTDFPRPGWTCNINGVPQSPILESPVTLILQIWDYDGDMLIAVVLVRRAILINRQIFLIPEQVNPLPLLSRAVATKLLPQEIFIL